VTGERPERPRRRPFPIRSEQALKDLAYRYMARFSCTTDKLRAYLRRKMDEAVALDEARAADSEPWIASVLARLTEVGVLNNSRYAEGRAQSLHRRGKAGRVIARDLQLKGAPPEAIAEALETLRQESPIDPDLAAAIHLARKRRLGPFAAPEVRQLKRDKHLAALARAGFRYDLAKGVIDAEDAEDLLALT